MQKIIKLALCLLVGLGVVSLIGCEKHTDGDEDTIAEVTELNEKWLNLNSTGDYEGMKAMLDGTLAEQFAPIVLYTNFTEQAPESKSCQEGSMDLSKYVMTRLYQEPKVEKVSISQDKSEARVLMTWKSIDTSKIDTTSLKDTVNGIVETQYQQRKDEYDANTEQYGEESTRLMLQDDAFAKVFEQIRKLYEDAPDKDMKGILCYSYKTNEGYKLTNISQYMDLLYHDDGTYNWDYESAQTTFDKDKERLEEETETK